ncbi:MAG: ABC transporter permease [Chloroflexota bacterium]|nr:ABC transporter permease [Chloroflexota bacterium]
MRRTLVVATRVLRQLIREHRLLGLSVVAPLVIVYFLKLFFDTMPPTFETARYAVPVAAFLVHFLAFLLCAIVLVQERTAGTLERMFINGFRRTEVIGGYLVGYLALATLQAIVALTEAVLLFQLNYAPGTLGVLFIVVWLLAVASVMLGIFISTFARNEGQVFPFIPMIIVPSVFLSGLILDPHRLPDWAEWLGRLLPLRYANNVIQEMIRPGGALGAIWPNLLVLVAYSVVLWVLASRTLAEVE